MGAAYEPHCVNLKIPSRLKMSCLSEPYVQIATFMYKGFGLLFSMLEKESTLSVRSMNAGVLWHLSRLKEGVMGGNVGLDLNSETVT